MADEPHIPDPQASLSMAHKLWEEISQKHHAIQGAVIIDLFARYISTFDADQQPKIFEHMIETMFKMLAVYNGRAEQEEDATEH